jgi:hypothetical protein
MNSITPIENAPSFEHFDMLTASLWTPSLVSLLTMMLLLGGLVATYMTYLYIRLIRMKSVRPFDELPTFPNAQ